jgi:hypothetical protein
MPDTFRDQEMTGQEKPEFGRILSASGSVIAPT